MDKKTAQKLQYAVNNFVRFSTPYDCNSSTPCTKLELTTAINNCSKVLNQIIDELTE